MTAYLKLILVKKLIVTLESFPKRMTFKLIIIFVSDNVDGRIYPYRSFAVLSTATNNLFFCMALIIYKKKIIIKQYLNRSLLSP